MLVNVNEINEALGIDLQSMLNVGQNNTTYVERKIQECEDDILQFISLYAWGGMKQVENYLKVPTTKEVIREAIIDQVAYKYDNLGQDKLGGILLQPNGGVTTLSINQRLDAMISPRAYRRLLNAGLLCSIRR